jgi:endonuclease/exonuclease/phosphatase (EEP) superfamily protein YafD
MRHLWTWSVWLAWFATVGLAWAAYNRLFVDDRTIPGTAFNAYTFWLFLPAYVMAGVFVIVRWWRPAALCGLLAALHVLWVAPLYSGADALPAGAEDGPRLTVVSSNLTAANPEKGRHARALQQLDGDVILVQEYTHEWADVSREAGFHESHPYSIEAPEERWTGTAIFSRFRLSGAEPWDMHGTTATRAQLEEAWGGLWLYSVHPDPPLFLFTNHHKQWDDLIDEAETRTGRRLFAGDFNITQFNAWYHELKDTGLDACHEDRGRGRATTWPVTRSWFPPLRLDHVFYSDGLACLSVREVRGHGTDHKIVVAEIAVIEE